MPIAGFTRFRSHLVGKQSVHGTAVTPTEAIGLRGVPDIDPNWQDQDGVDTGSIDPTLPAYRTQTDITETLTGPLTYNLVPFLMNGTVRGGTSPTGAVAKTWTHTALSLTATTLDEYTDEFGDDYTGDGMRLVDGIVESLDLSFDDSLGPWQVSAQYRFGKVVNNITRASNLVVGSNLPLVFGADTILYINDTSGSIGTTAIAQSVHAASIHFGNTIDQKRFADGSNLRFSISGYGLAGREITGSITFAKTDAVAKALDSEVVDWLQADPVTRYMSLVSISSALVPGSATAHSWTQTFSGTWRKRSDGEMGGNSTITLDFTGRYDSALGYAYKSITVCSRAS